MGFCRLLYRIGRMLFRDFLFKIPKKYLVVIIIFLSMFIFKANVFAYSNYDTFPVDDVTTDLVFYDYVTFRYGNELNSMITGPFKSGDNFNNNYKFEVSYKNIGGNKPFLFYTNRDNENFKVYSNFTTQYEGMIFNYAGYQNKIYPFSYGADVNKNLKLLLCLRPDYEYTGNLLGYYEYYEDDVKFRNGSISMGTTDFNTSMTETIKFGYSNIMYYRNFKIWQYDNNQWNLMWNFYPCKYIDSSGDSVQYITGYYDSVSGDFYYYNGFTFNDNYILDEVPEELLPSNPFITNEASSINIWNFDTLNIDGGSVTDSINGVQSNFFLRQEYNDKVINLPINQYKSVSNSGIVSFNIPRSVLLSDSAIINGYSVTFNLDVYTSGVLAPFSLGTYTFSLTQTEQDNINQDRTQQSLDNISQQQQQTTNAINNLNNNITNDNVSNSVIQQPSVPNDTSGVENGVNNIFNVIMNAFTNFDSSQDVVLPIPYTNKNITISGNYTRDMLNSVNATWVINFITIFWWYIISVYIVKDILKTVDKIQEGNIDKVESSNIKGDML